MIEKQTRILTLNKDEHLQHDVFRLQTGCALHFRTGSSLFGRRITVYTNHPKNMDHGFERAKHRKLDWKSDSTHKSDDTALFAEVEIILPGSFYFYVTDDCTENAPHIVSGYYLVDPILTIGKNEVLPLDSIQCETYLSKCLGTLDEWDDRLMVSKRAGFNVIHLTPIQELGKSRSGYSLKDQLKLNPEFSHGAKNFTMDDVQKLVKKMKEEWKVLTVTDIVLNHTTNESPWLKEHPECAYNLVNSPHLRPAYIIDRTLYWFSLDVASGKFEARGIPAAINRNEHVEAIHNALKDVLFRPKVEEYFMVNIDRLVEAYRNKLSERRSRKGRPKSLKPLVIIQDPNYHRLTSTVDLNLAVHHFWNKNGESCNSEEVNESTSHFKACLEELNDRKRGEIHGDLCAAINCTLGTARYERIQDDGPKYACVSEEHMLCPPYFTHFGEDLGIEEEELLSFKKNGNYIMAHNGWVMGDDPLRNFADKDSNVYLRRELIAWGDSVKLRYGKEPADNPYLWKHMRQYVEETAKVFHGIRLDNCHSTPIYVAEYLLDCARKIRPNLYVFAELFTASERTDNVFVNRLGINSLVREAMSAGDSHEEGRLVYKYGGDPVGAFLQPPVRPLVPCVAHAIFFEITHDNKSPCETRTAWDFLPTSAVVGMASCAIGSTRGYGEIVPKQIHVVNEERRYTKWTNDAKERGLVNSSSGILKCKKLINDLHCYLGSNGYNQVFVDQVTEHIVTVTRHNPVTHESVVLVAYTAFQPPVHISKGYIRPLKFQGKLEHVIFEFQIDSQGSRYQSADRIPEPYEDDPDFINGLESFDVRIKESFPPSESNFLRQISPTGSEFIEYEYTDAFVPGSVFALKLRLQSDAQEAVNKIRTVLKGFSYSKRISHIESRDEELAGIVSELSLSDLNRILYRCDLEERDEGLGGGAYQIPNFSPLCYCGLQGIISTLDEISRKNDLGHPLCCNLRDGDWLMDYTSGRMKLQPSSERLGRWLQDVVDVVKALPRYLIPSYFDAVIKALHLLLLNHAWNSMGSFVSNGSDFAKSLGLGSVQFCGVVKSSLLPILSTHLDPPLPPTTKIEGDKFIQTSVTLAAGLPHFCMGYMRNWGRDTFIALPGNLLMTERFHEARWIILAYAQTMRHGLIPNLLDGGQKARFNCRDALWFWLYAIQRYVTMKPEGHKILKDKVSRIFPTDESPALSPGGAEDQLLEDVIQEALAKHFQGLTFRERNAGFQIDSQMTDEGFNNEIGVDLQTGFPYGGNIHNCGTWMDKMGSSEKARNKGMPATPRDGSAVEIVGLCKSSLGFLHGMHRQRKFSYDRVQRTDVSGNTIEWTYSFWGDQIARTFEEQFWVNDSPTPGETSPELINRRGIYKDSVNASQPWANFQLRCNFSIAIAAAPELFSPGKATMALDRAEDLLLGPLGMKTLDPSDWVYRGDYDNGNDSEDTLVARGFNYHQGPEWLWPVGWFLRAKLAVASKVSPETLRDTIARVKSLLAAHFQHLVSSPWRSLPELTNANGSFCRDSNPAQSWSTGCLLEVLFELNQLESRL